MNQKSFINIAVIIGVIILIGVAGYFVVNRQTSPPEPIPLPPENSAPTPSPISTPTPSPTPKPKPTPSVSDQKQSFETVAKRGYSGHYDRKDYVIKENSEWRSLWDIVNTTVAPRPVLPSIDFGNEMIIAVFQGNHSTGGYSIEIIEILEKANSLEVTVKETSPSPGSIVTQAFTQPFHIIKTKRIDKKVVFMR
ncbi:MAG: protease complex subunit PrcB family protein [bacterium]|nr:protease complex subunit PrcB family protein [bacterium]